MMKQKLETKIIENNIGIAAADYSPSRAWVNFPLVGNPETSSWALTRIWKRARSLYANSPEVRFAVNTLASMVGTISPRPQSGDEKWDKKAREVFLKRTSNPHLFDANGVLNFQQAQLWIERRAIIDGDNLTVLTHGKDGGGQVQFYSAPQITSDGEYKEGYQTGVVADKSGKVKGYNLYDWHNEKPFFCAANRSILYRHNPEPSSHRGASELIAAITTAQDIFEIWGFTKAAVKAASLFGIIEVQDNNARSTFSDLAALRNPARAASGGTTTQTQTNTQDLGVKIGETRAITLSPGHRLETLHDSRPSNEQMNFVRKLIDSIAYAVGVDPNILYNPSELGSASTRFILAKSRDLITQRLQDRMTWANKIWQFVISCEVAAGRLEKCPTDNWDRVQWVGGQTWSIDLGRDANSAMQLIAQGLMSADDWCIQNFGKSHEEIFEQNLHSISHNMAKAQEAGIDYFAVAAPNAGSTYIPEEVNATEKEETSDEDGIIG